MKKIKERKSGPIMWGASLNADGRNSGSWIIWEIHLSSQNQVWINLWQRLKVRPDEDMVWAGASLCSAWLMQTQPHSHEPSAHTQDQAPAVTLLPQASQMHRSDFDLFTEGSWRNIKEQMAPILSISLPGKTAATSGFWWTPNVLPFLLSCREGVGFRVS